MKLNSQAEREATVTTFTPKEDFERGKKWEVRSAATLKTVKKGFKDRKEAELFIREETGGPAASKLFPTIEGYLPFRFAAKLTPESRAKDLGKETHGYYKILNEG